MANLETQLEALRNNYIELNANDFVAFIPHEHGNVLEAMVEADNDADLILQFIALFAVAIYHEGNLKHVRINIDKLIEKPLCTQN